MKKRSATLRRTTALAALLAGVALCWWLVRRGDDGKKLLPAPSPTLAVVKNSPAKISVRRLPVAHTSAQHEWTDADGKAAAVIRQLAHNDLEIQRLTDENDSIFRRQLVYRKQTMSDLAQHALQTGEPIRELLVPGLDGQEFRVEVRDVELTDGGANGTFSGHLLGQPDSMVTLAFKGGREAFTIVSSAQNIFLAAEAREPGEVVVKQIDPAKYGGLGHPCTVN
jgi:hypothetical protein